MMNICNNLFKKKYIISWLHFSKVNISNVVWRQ